MIKKVYILTISMFLFLCIGFQSLQAQMLSKPEMYQSIERRQRILSELPQILKFPEPGTIAKIVIPESVLNLSKEAYYSALDYNQSAIDSLNYAKYFLSSDDLKNANKYIERSERLTKLSDIQMKGALQLLDSAIDMGEYYLLAKAAGIAISTITGPFGHALVTAFELESEYQVDKLFEGPEKAKADLFKKALVEVVVQASGAGEFAQKAWGSSRVYPVLNKLIGSSEFKDKVLESFMRLGGKAAGYTTEEALKIITDYMLLLEGREPLRVKETKQSISSIAKQTPRPAIDLSTQSALQDFKQLVSPFRPLVEPFVPLVKPTLDASKVAERTAQQQLTPVKDMPFTQTFSGPYEKPSSSPYKVATYSNTGPGFGTRSGVFPGNFSANYSITATSTENNTFSSYSSGTFSANMSGKVSGFQEGTLKGTGNMNMTAGTTGGTNFSFLGPVTVEPSGKLTFETNGTFTLGNNSGTTTGTWTQVPK